MSDYPSVSIVAGPLTPARNTTIAGDHMLRMHGGAMYITIDAETAKQWVDVLGTITKEAN